MKKKALTIVLTLALCLGLLSVTAFAADTVNYVEYTWNETTGLSSETKSVTDYIEVTEETKEWSDGSWYVVKGNVTIDSRVTVNGSANLVLTDGCSLSTNGITVETGNTLTIYGQSQGDGNLSAIATDNFAAGIGGDYPGHSCGTVVIHGGVVTAESNLKFCGAGIGGAGGGAGTSIGKAGSGGTVTVYSGTVTAMGGYDGPGYNQSGGAGIGGGGGQAHRVATSGDGGEVNIYGGIVTAIGGYKRNDHYCGSGIGGGGCDKESKGGNGGNVTIAGGIVTATGHGDGIGRGHNGPGDGQLSAENCIVNGNVYGSFTLTENYTVAEGMTLTIPENAALTINDGVTLTVEGTLVNNGSITNYGTLNLQTKDKLSGAGTVTGTGTKQILSITADQIIVPTDLVYNGEDQTQAAQNVIGRSLGQGGETICGTFFEYACRFDSISPAEVKDAGTYTVSYKNDRNETVTQTFSVAPKYITGAVASTFAEMIYTGSGQTPVAAVTIDNLPVTGSWSEVTNVTDTTTFTANGNFTGSIGSYPTGMQPKSVTAVVAVQDKYWDGSDAAEVTVTADTGIEGEDIIISGVTATFVDGDIGENKAVTLIQESMEITYPNNRPDNYHVTVADTAAADIKVIPLTISGVAMDADAYTYGDPVGYDSTAVGIEQPGGTAANAEDLVYTYTGTANDDTRWTDTTAPTKAGSYTLTVCHRDAVHYTGTQSVSFTIERKPVEVPVQAEAVTYNGQEQTYAVTETEYYSVDGGVHTDANEAGYEVTISLKDRNNTCWTGGSLDDLTHGFVINKALVTVTAKNQSVYVGGTAPDLSSPELNTHYTVTGLVGADTLGGVITMEYQKDSEAATPDTSKSGTYDIVISGATVPNDTNYSGITFNPGTLTIRTWPSSGGGVYTPPVQNVTVPISGDDNTIHVGASVSGDKAVIDEVDLSHLNEVIGDNVEEVGTVTIDFSNLNSSKPITTVELPANVVKQIAEAVNDPGNDAQSLEVVLSNGLSIEFDAVALGEKAAQVDGLDITISIENAKDAKPNQKQEAALKGRPAYEISVTSGGEHISDMGGKITIHAPYELQDGEHPRGIIVWYVDEDGKRERCETSYDPAKKRVNWKTDHLSLYMIDYDETLAKNPFSDVSSDAYYFDAVLWALDTGITGGTTASTFSPGNPCTRAQMATFLWRAAGSPEPVGSTNPFTDVSADTYYAKAVQWAVEQGITVGTSETTFSPDAPCTRAQMAVFLYRNEQSKGGGFTGAWMFHVPFNDVPEWAFEAIAWCYMKGVTSGTSATTFSPDAPCTRAQTVTFLHRYFGN